MAKQFKPKNSILVVIDLDGTIVDSSERLDMCGIHEATTQEERAEAYKKYNQLPTTTDEQIQHHVGMIRGILHTFNYQYAGKVTIVAVTARWDTSFTNTRDWIGNNIPGIKFEQIVCMPTQDGYGVYKNNEEVTEYKISTIQQLKEDYACDDVYVFEDSFPTFLAAYSQGWGACLLTHPDFVDRSHDVEIDEDED
jgi:hypothetical protein